MPLALAAYHLVWSEGRSSCRYEKGMEQTGLCGNGPDVGGGENALPGTPMMAFAVKDGRATAVLAGVVTKAGGEYDVLARVAVTHPPQR